MSSTSPIRVKYELPRPIRDQRDFERLEAQLLALEDPRVDEVERWIPRPDTAIFVGRNFFSLSAPAECDKIQLAIESWGKLLPSV